ncbi:MAG: HigA family addiction module antitoxin [Pseudomonadota bacterium]
MSALYDQGIPPSGVPLRTPPHPGRFLDRHLLAPLGMSQTEAAKRLGISRRRLNELIQGRRGFTLDTAIRCALLFGADAALWLGMQSAYDSFQCWKRLRAAGL